MSYIILTQNHTLLNPKKLTNGGVQPDATLIRHQNKIFLCTFRCMKLVSHESSPGFFVAEVNRTVVDLAKMRCFMKNGSHKNSRLSVALIAALCIICLQIQSLSGQENATMNEKSTTPAIIAVDPGHPSETSNGCAHHGLTELQICWDVALKLEKLINDQAGLEAIKTKDRVDQMVTNRQRAEIANAASAALMVRLHCDSGKGAGCTVYYPDRQGTVDGVTGPAQKVIDKSRTAAEAMQKGLAETLKQHLHLNPIKTDSVTYVGSKQGALTGSIFSQVPTVVIEMVYLNNASNAAFIKEPQNQELMAGAILQGILAYVRSEPEETAQIDAIPTMGAVVTDLDATSTIPMPRYCVNFMQIPHCKRGPERCQICRDRNIMRWCLLDIDPPDQDRVQRPVIELEIAGEKHFRVFDIIKVFESEEDMKQYMLKNKFPDRTWFPWPPRKSKK